MHLIIWPERRYLTDEQLVLKAQDDIENRDSDICNLEDLMPDAIELARAVLMDSGTVTFGRQ